MDKTDLEIKYQKLATEYSKLRSQATVLKKAVLDEQSKQLSQKDIIKEQEQTIRKHHQEMESIFFRNEQLTKRITVLQEELQKSGTPSKKNKSIVMPEKPIASHVGVIDEELQKRIVENAQLAILVADKDIEVNTCKEKIELLERKISKLNLEVDEYKNKFQENKEKSSSSVIKECDNCKNMLQSIEELSFWKSECKLLNSKPENADKLTKFFETQIEDLIKSLDYNKSKAISIETDNEALKNRLEHLGKEHRALESILEKCTEELHTTSENYKSQLDAMTEHLASQNEKIARQCDEIEILKHNLSLRK